MESRLEPAEQAKTSSSDRCRPARHCRGGFVDERHCNEEPCGSAQSTRRMPEQTGPFTDLIVFAEQQAALESGEPVQSSAAAAIGEHRHAFSQPSTDQLTETGAGRELAQQSCRSAAYTRVEWSERQKELAPGILVQHGFSDKRVVAGLQGATAAAVPALNHSRATDRQNDSINSSTNHGEECEAAVQRVALVWAFSPRHSPSKQAVPGTATHAEGEPDSDSTETHRSSRLPVSLQPPCQGLLTGAAAMQQDAVCESDARLSGVALSDACASVEVSEVSSSGCSSPAATLAHDVQCPYMQKAQERSTPEESPLHDSLPPAPVQHIEGSSTSSQLAAHAHPSAVTPHPAASERASSPALTEAGVATSHCRGTVLIQTAIVSPESLSSSPMDSMRHEVGEQLEAHHATTNEGIKSAPGMATPLMHKQAGVLPGSRKDPGKSTHPGSSEQPGQASSSGSRHLDTVTKPQSTSTADNEPQGLISELAQEVFSSLQLSNSLTSASQELLAAMHSVQTPSAVEDAGLWHPADPTALTTQFLEPVTKNLQCCGSNSPTQQAVSTPCRREKHRHIRATAGI